MNNFLTVYESISNFIVFNIWRSYIFYNAAYNIICFENFLRKGFSTYWFTWFS